MRIRKDVYSYKDADTLKMKYDYIFEALSFLHTKGRLQFSLKYPNLYQNFTIDDLIFYLNEIERRIKYIDELQKLDEMKYLEKGLI